MGMMGNMNMAQAMPDNDPCHDIGMAVEQDMQSNCLVCIDSEKLWSQDLVIGNKDTVLQDFLPAIFPMAWDENELQNQEIVEAENIPDPPDIAFWASPLRTQAGVVLLN